MGDSRAKSYKSQLEYTIQKWADARVRLAEFRAHGGFDAEELRNLEIAAAIAEREFQDAKAEAS